MRQTYENNKRRIQTFKLTADVKDDNGRIHHFFEGYEYVEIGGIKWAICNVGAEKETDSGLYFAWGETQGHKNAKEKNFTWNDYKFVDNGSIFKYNRLDGLTKLEPCDDAATQNMGENWRMPTYDEFSTLLSSTTKKWTTVNGINGKVFTDINDNSKKLFFPAVGYCGYGCENDVGSYGNYWSSSCRISSDFDRWYLFLNSVGCYMFNDNRCYGFPVRGVTK